MADGIIPLPGNVHREVQTLLPWHVTGRLDPAEHKHVDAHVAECDDCRAQLAIERQIQRAVKREPASVEQGWNALQASLGDGEPRERRQATAETRIARRPARWAAMALAAQVVLLVGGSAVVLAGRQPAYHALGGIPARAEGNVVVMFRPDASEAELRHVLRMNNARLVDGPTASDAYLLMVPRTTRGSALAELRRSPQVVLAEPIDAGPPE